MYRLQADNAMEFLDSECPDIECGAVFSYRRISLGQLVVPNFCPTCGSPMIADSIILDLIAEYPHEGLSDGSEPRDQQLPQLAS